MTMSVEPISLHVPFVLIFSTPRCGRALRTTAALRVLRCHPSPSPVTTVLSSQSRLLLPHSCRFLLLRMEPSSSSSSSSSSFYSRSYSSASYSSRRSGKGRGRESDTREDRNRGRGSGGDAESERIDALGRLLTRILRHMASELNLDMRSDGYVRVHDLLKLNMTTYAKVPLRSHTVEEIREAVKRDNKQRFSLLEQDGELLIRANQGHTVKSNEHCNFFAWVDDTHHNTVDLKYQLQTFQEAVEHRIQKFEKKVLFLLKLLVYLVVANILFSLVM